MLFEKIRLLAQNYINDTISIRQHIHANPELSFEELETSKFIAAELTKLQIPFVQGIAGTGLVALIEGQNPNSKCIAFRADFDALPITEKNNCDYKSKKEGVMHACGHDVHTACLLGAARILNETKTEWNGTVKLIFQPGEEKDPGGASIMIAEGVLENPKPDAIFALHVYPHLPAGIVGTKAGTYMASADEVYITVKGKGGHAAMPHLCVDPIVIASQLILSLQTMITRQGNPIDHTVFTIGKISGGTKGNIIPDEVFLEGTLRCMNETWRAKCFEILEKQSKSLCQSLGGDAEIKILKGYPCVHNDEALTTELTRLLKTNLGEAQVVDLPLRMTADDFAFYSHLIPGSYIRIGTTNADGTKYTSPVHTATFDIDETAIQTGMEVICSLAIGA
jgi:amidohydrolase